MSWVVIEELSPGESVAPKGKSSLKASLGKEFR